MVAFPSPMAHRPPCEPTPHRTYSTLFCVSKTLMSSGAELWASAMWLIGVSWVDGSTAGGMRGMTATSCCPLGSRYCDPTTLAICLVLTKELPSGFHFDQARPLSLLPRPTRTMRPPTAAPRTTASTA